MKCTRIYFDNIVNVILEVKFFGEQEVRNSYLWYDEGLPSKLVATLEKLKAVGCISAILKPQ